MKKSMTCLLMVLVMVVGMCIPASAAGIEPKTLELIPVEDVDTASEITGINNDIPTEEAMPVEALPAMQEGVSTDAVTYEVRNSVNAKSVRIKPIVVNVQTGEAFIVNDISRFTSWSNGAQFEALFLSSDEVKAFVKEISDALTTSTNTSASTWAIIGWYVNAIVGLTAQQPDRVEYAQSFPPSGTNYETKTLTVTSQSVNLNVSGQFYFTPNMDPEEYYYVGFEGHYYFTYASGPNQGREGSIMFTCGVAMN